MLKQYIICKYVTNKLTVTAINICMSKKKRNFKERKAYFALK